MTKVKFEAATGTELRQQMLDFLGLGATVIKGVDIQAIMERTKPTQDDPPTEEKLVDTQAGAEATNILAEEAPKTRRRRSKAEIEAEKTAESTENVMQGNVEDAQTANGIETPEETPAKEEVVTKEEGPKVTKESLTPLVLNLGRAGRKGEVVALLANFTQADGTTPVAGLPTLQPSDYQAFHDEIVKL